MSGTSADGVSAVAARFSGPSFEILGETTLEYPKTIVQAIRKGPTLSAQELSRLNFQVGDVFAIAAQKLIHRLRLKPADHRRMDSRFRGNDAIFQKHNSHSIVCIGSHGQTIYHGPHDARPNTLQIGEPAVIAQKTGLPVISHFREADIAAGGEGAPLIPFFDQFFFGRGPVRALQNLGGIANVTVVGKNIKKPIAFDTGPGNCLMDEAIRIMTHDRQDCDQNGRLAARGVIDYQIIERWLKDPYFSKTPPKSTGLEKFSRRFLLKSFGRSLQRNTPNVLATLNYFTAASIFESYLNFIFPFHPVSEIIISGGGAKNPVLMRNLKTLFHPIPVLPISHYGVPAQVKEPLAFAFFGLRRIQELPNHWPETTGASSLKILGRVTL